MFKSFSVTVFTTLLFMMPTQTRAASENPFAVHFPVKEGVVYYAIRGSKRGAKLLYFKDYGEKQLLVERESSSFMGKGDHGDKVTLILPDAKYLLDTKHKVAQKIPKLSSELFRLYQKLSSSKKQKILSALKQRNGKSLENLDGSCLANAMKIAGLPCNEEEKAGRRICQNGALTLASEISILGFTVQTFATKIEVKKVDPALFRLPADFKIVSNPKKRTDAQKIIRRLLSSQPITPCQKSRSQTEREAGLHEALYEEIHRLSTHF